MFILKTLLIVLMFVYSTSSVYAVTWYDKLPENGEVAPKALKDGSQPNYSGSIDFQSEQPSEVVEEPGSGVAPVIGEPGVEQAHNSGSESRSLYKSLGIWPLGVVVILILVAGTLLFLRKKQRA